MELFNSFGLTILNGSCKSDRVGNYTFIRNQRSKVIDYGLVSGDWPLNVVDFKVGELPYSPANYTNNPAYVVEVQDSEIKLLPKLAWRNRMEDNYKRELDEHLHRESNLSFDKLERILKKSYGLVNFPKRQNKERESWFDKEYECGRQHSFSYLRAFKTSNEETVKDSYIQGAMCN